MAAPIADFVTAINFFEYLSDPNMSSLFHRHLDQVSFEMELSHFHLNYQQCFLYSNREQKIPEH